MKTMISIIAVLGLGGFITPLADAPDGRVPMQAVAAAAPEVVQQRGNLGEQERQARIDLTLAQTRLELVLARQALHKPDYQDAASRALRVLDLLKGLPPDVDVSDYELQAEGIVARAQKAGINVEALRAQAGREQPLPQPDDNLNDPVRAEARDTRTAADAHRRRVVQRPVPDQYAYHPGKASFDIDVTLERDHQRLGYEAALRKAYQADAARLLTEVDEARVVPATDLAYPNDWPDKVARRKKYAGGEIARSKSWTDKDGREWYVAIYDIQDLIYVPPDFQPTFSLDPVEDLRNALDRDALRWRSGLFNWGTSPADWWNTIPLLRYFGGVDDYAFRGPKYSAERQQQIVEMIQAFTTQTTESKIISLEPIGP